MNNVNSLPVRSFVFTAGLFILLSSAIYSFARWRYECQSAIIYEDRYLKITEMMADYEVEKILNGKGVDIQPPGWAGRLEELPEFGNGMTVEFRLPDGSDPMIKVNIPRDSPVWWKQWKLDGPGDRWIAVGFFWLGEGGIASRSRVAAKRKFGF
jgi:hypothetical protein